MQRILHIIDRDTRRDMLDQLALLARNGEKIVSAGRPPDEHELGRSVGAVHKPLGISLLCGWRMRRLGKYATLVHAWSPAAAAASQALCRRIGARLLRSLPCLPSREELKKLLASMRRRRVHVTVPSSSARRAMLAAGAPEERVHVLAPPAEPIDDLTARRARTRQALGVTDGEVLLTAPAEMIRLAGHKYASWAHAIVRVILGHVRLLLPGGGPAEQHVRFFAGTTGYDPEVFFPGQRFGRKDVLAATDVALFFYERDCGMAAVAAAMAAGRAIAASSTPDLSEHAPHEQVALLAEPRDPRSASAAVLRLCEDPDLAARLAAAAQKRAAERFDRRACRQRLDEIYQLVVSSGPA